MSPQQIYVGAVGQVPIVLKYIAENVSTDI
jgi:hypothetical protein